MFSPQSSDDEEGLGKGRGRHILVNKTEMPGWSETLESFRMARESWDLLHSHEILETGNTHTHTHIFTHTYSFKYNETKNIFKTRASVRK